MGMGCCQSEMSIVKYSNVFECPTSGCGCQAHTSKIPVLLGTMGGALLLSPLENVQNGDERFSPCAAATFRYLFLPVLNDDDSRLTIMTVNTLMTSWDGIG